MVAMSHRFFVLLAFFFFYMWKIICSHDGASGKTAIEFVIRWFTVFSRARGQLMSFEGTIQSATLMQFHPSQNDFPRGCRATNSNRAGYGPWARIQFPGDPSLQYGPVDLDLGSFERDTLIGHEMAIFHRADLNAENSTRYSKDLGCEAFQVTSSSGQAPYSYTLEFRTHTKKGGLAVHSQYGKSQ
jgi:hypothetical protein